MNVYYLSFDSIHPRNSIQTKHFHLVCTSVNSGIYVRNVLTRLPVKCAMDWNMEQM